MITQAAQERWYRTYYPLVYRRVYRLVGHHQVLRLLVQDVFVKLAKASDRLAFSSEQAVQAWLYRTATTTAFDMLDHRRVLTMQSFPEDVCLYTPEQDDPVFMSEMHESIRRLLGPISKRDATWLVLTAQGYSSLDIAKQAHIQASTVRMAITRARKILIAQERGEA